LSSNAEVSEMSGCLPLSNTVTKHRLIFFGSYRSQCF